MKPICQFLILLMLSAPASVSAQKKTEWPDTTGITLAEAERIFVEKNLQLLAARFNIDAARAAIVQAGLWNNPNIAIEQNVYNPGTKRYFDFTKDGNTEVALQQLVLLAGKRGAQVRLAEINSDMTEQGFFDLLRSLRLELRTDFYDLYFLQQSLMFYNQSVAALRKTVASAENILERRSILLSEVLRVKSLLFTLENERLGLMNKAIQIQWDLHVLLHDSLAVYYVPVLNRNMLDSLSLDTVSLSSVIRQARENRPDIKIAMANVHSAETNLVLQKALAVPDVTIGGRWSRAGSYIPDYFAVAVAVDLPLFNRNQGNIQQAELAYRGSKALLDNALSGLEKDVATAYSKALTTDQLYKALDRKFTGQYEELVAGMIKTYENRNLSVIQFTDFYESYRTSVVQMNQLQNDRIDAFETLNYVTGTNVFAKQ